MTILKELLIIFCYFFQMCNNIFFSI